MESGSSLLLENDGNITLEGLNVSQQTDLSCLTSTVRNTSGKAMIFGFLPPHGRRLEAGEEFTVFGDILAAIGTNAGAEYAVARRAQFAFMAAVERGDLTIVSTPNPIMTDWAAYDAATTEEAKLAATQMAGNVGGALTLSAPCWYPAATAP